MKFVMRHKRWWLGPLVLVALVFGVLLFMMDDVPFHHLIYAPY